MPTRRALLTSAAALLALSLAAPAIAQSDRPMPVVATFSILGDMVKRIGGEHIAVTTLVGSDGDTHVYQPTPADARAVSEAKILVVNGLQFEGWLDRLIDASDFRGVRVVATEGGELIAFDDEHEDRGSHEAHAEEAGHDDHHDDEAHAEGDDHDHHHGAFDPHAWQSLGNALAYVDNIAAALAQADPANAAAFHRNRAAYDAEIEALDAEIREIVAALPADRRTVVTSHDAFQCFGRDYGLTFLAPQGSAPNRRRPQRMSPASSSRSVNGAFVPSSSRMSRTLASWKASPTRPGPPSAARSILARCPARTVRHRPTST